MEGICSIALRAFLSSEQNQIQPRWLAANLLHPIFTKVPFISQCSLKTVFMQPLNGRLPLSSDPPAWSVLCPTPCPSQHLQYLCSPIPDATFDLSHHALPPFSSYSVHLFQLLFKISNLFLYVCGYIWDSHYYLFRSFLLQW